LTLQRAFPGHAIADVLDRIQNGDFPAARTVNPAVPSDLDAICAMALDIDPARRYPTARALRQDLERYLGDDEVPIASRSSGSRRFALRTRSILRKHPWKLGIAGMVVVGLVVGLWSWSQRPPVQRPLLAAFCLATEVTATPEPVPLAEGQDVQAGDYMGVTVAANAPQFVYALSTFQPSPGDRRFSPMEPIFMEDLDKKLDRANPWRLEIPADRLGEPVHVLCARILPENRVEGLLVFAGEEVRKDVEAWFESLVYLQQRGMPDGVPEAEAIKALHDPPNRTRGSSPTNTPLEARQVLSARIQEVLRKKQPDLDVVEGLTTLKIECPVAPAR
jgi:hypothetical protein